MEINWNELNQDDLFDNKLYDEILSIQESSERIKTENKLFETAKKFKITGRVKDSYEEYKNYQKQREIESSTIDFGEKANIRKMFAPGYYKDSNNNIRTFDKNILVTSTALQPIAILKNSETGEELIKCAFLVRNKWSTFVINRETLQHNGKITKLANKGVDVTSESAKLLVNYIRNLLNNNKIPELKSTSKMGWHDNCFLPYDDSIQFDGEENYTAAFNSLHSNGNFEDWYKEVHKDRFDNVPLKLVMAASFASPLLYLLHKQSFVTLIWGRTGGKKTVAGRIAMSIWRR